MTREMNKGITNDNWGRKKREIVITLGGDCTEMQFREMERRILKICEKFDFGFAATDPWRDEEIL